MSGIYIHIPFCKQACHYCNFHFSTSLRFKTDLVDCIVDEIHMTAGYLPDSNIRSIYFGGGTPSLLDADELTKIIGALKDNYSWNDDVEITLEANPDDIVVSKLDLWKQIGVNRLSIGIQSFFNEDLKWMNRAHNAAEARSSLKKAKEAGFENITVDLIYGSPTTTDKMWKKNILMVLENDLPHISSYCLTVEKGTALAHFVAKGKSPDVDQEKAKRQFEMLIDLLTNHGYEHYEISNFAKNGRYSIHNSSYWTGDDYLGVGPGAHSYNGISRRWNVANNMKYLKAVKQQKLPYKEEILSDVDRYNEYIITRLRTIWGLNLQDISKDFHDYFLERISKAIQEGYVETSNNLYILTLKGKHFADKVSMELMITE